MSLSKLRYDRSSNLTWIMSIWFLVGLPHLWGDAMRPVLKTNFNGELFAAWLGDINSSYPSIQYSHRSSSGTWSDPINLSSAIAGTPVSAPPHLYLTEFGVIVIWQNYITSAETPYYSLASAILPKGDHLWSVMTVSTSEENACFNDPVLTIDAPGQVNIMWTSLYPAERKKSVIRTASFLMGSSIAWSEPLTLGQ